MGDTDLEVDSPFFFSAIVLFTNRIHSPRVFGGFLERSGSLDRMEMEVTPRCIDDHDHIHIHIYIYIYI